MLTHSCTGLSDRFADALAAEDPRVRVLTPIRADPDSSSLDIGPESTQNNSLISNSWLCAASSAGTSDESAFPSSERTFNHFRSGSSKMRGTERRSRRAPRVEKKSLEPISKSSEEDDKAGELNEAEKVASVIFPADEDAPLPLYPGEEALDQPTSHVTA